MTVPRIKTEVNVTPIMPIMMLKSILQRLPPNQREALEMVYAGGTDDETVCALKELTTNELATVRASVRNRFMAISASQGSKAMSAGRDIP